MNENTTKGEKMGNPKCKDDAAQMMEKLRSHGIDKVSIEGNWITIKAPVPGDLLGDLATLGKRATDELVLRIQAEKGKG